MRVLEKAVVRKDIIQKRDRWRNEDKDRKEFKKVIEKLERDEKIKRVKVQGG